MQSILLEILERTRKFGYLYWPQDLDRPIKNLMAGREEIGVILDNLYLGEKKVDYKYRRISLGPAKVRAIPDRATVFQLRVNKNGRLDIKCR